MNKHNKILTTTLIFLGLSNTSLAENVTSITIQDIGSGWTNAYTPTTDGVAGYFSFSSITAANLGGTTPQRFTSQSAINTSIANPSGSFTTGFLFGGQPFVPWTSDPIVADISISGGIPVLTIASTQAALPWGGYFNNFVDFQLHPTLTPNLDPNPAERCNFTANPHVPLTILWVNRIGETDQYNYAMRWNHCITNAEDPTASYVTFNAAWYLEGIMTVADTIAPTVVTAISNGGSSASDSSIIVTFSEPMNPATVTTSSFLVYPTADGPSFTECNTVTASNNNKTFTCSPNVAFSTNGSTPYTLRLTSTITDDGTNPSANALTLVNRTFTMTGPDTIDPTFDSATPANNATGVATNTTISVTFDDGSGMAAITATAISLSEGGNQVSATFTSSDNLTFSYTPTTPLKNNTVYTLFVDSTIAQDPSGNLLDGGDQTRTFTTATATTLTRSGATVTLGGTGASMVYLAYISAAQAQAVAGVPSLPARITLDDNFIDYIVNNVSTGVTVTLDFPNPITGKEIYKAVNGSIVKLTEGTGNDQYTRVDADTITMIITDNGPLDNDETTTGVIHDPIGTGLDIGAKPVPGSLSGCTGSIIDSNIELSQRAEWLLVAAFIAFMGLFARRRRS